MSNIKRLLEELQQDFMAVKELKEQQNQLLSEALGKDDMTREEFIKFDPQHYDGPGVEVYDHQEDAN